MTHNKQFYCEKKQDEMILKYIGLFHNFMVIFWINYHILNNLGLHT